MNMHVHVYIQVPVLNSLGYTQGVEFLSGNFRVNFMRNLCFPRQLNHFTFPPAMYEHSIFLHPKTQQSKN